MTRQNPNTPATKPASLNRLSPDTTARAAALAAPLDLTKEALALMTPEMKPRQFINTLAESALYIDAVKIMAAALDKAAAVRWALACVKTEKTAPKAQSDVVCRTTIEAWLSEETEKNRRLAMTVAESSGMTTAYHWLAAAVGWSGGSLAPAEFAEVRPPEHLTAVAAACAIRIAAQADPGQFDARLLDCLKLGARFAVGEGTGQAS